MAPACGKAHCTVAQTGICLLNNNPETCPERIPKLGDSSVSVPPPLSPPRQNPKFPSSFTLTPEATSTLTADRYFRLIGILGAPDAGKTAILVSLYLLLARDRLKDFAYADSQTLMAFDEISRGARRWNEGHPPEQMTSHTELSDERTAGFLHLRLQDRGNSEYIDLLLPDLPGEWSTSLMDSNRVDRLEFLKSADLIWLTVDGRQMITPSTRQQMIHRTSLLLERVSTFLSPKIPSVFIVISHKDFGDPPEATLLKVKQEAHRFKVNLKIFQVSSFSENEAIDPGTGINELLVASLRSARAPRPRVWPDSFGVDAHRQFLKMAVRGINR